MHIEKTILKASSYPYGFINSSPLPIEMRFSEEDLEAELFDE